MTPPTTAAISAYSRHEVGDDGVKVRAGSGGGANGPVMVEAVLDTPANCMAWSISASVRPGQL